MKTQKIGQRISAFMAKKQLTREDLVERTGLQPEFLRLVQEEDVVPSLGPLLKIARAMGVRLGTLLDDQVSADPLIIRLDQRSEELSMLRAKGEPVSHRFYSLGAGKTDRHMEPFFVELLPNPQQTETLSSHEGEEFIIVMSGVVNIRYGRETYQLQPGDSIYYNSIVPHEVACHGAAPASIYAVLYFPD